MLLCAKYHGIRFYTREQWPLMCLRMHCLERTVILLPCGYAFIMYVLYETKRITLELLFRLHVNSDGQ